MNFRCSQDWHSRVSVNRLQEAPLSKRLFQYVSGFPFAWTQMWIGGFRMCLWKGCLDWSWPLDESLLSNKICSEKCLLEKYAWWWWWCWFLTESVSLWGWPRVPYICACFSPLSQTVFLFYLLPIYFYVSLSVCLCLFVSVRLVYTFEASSVLAGIF